MDLSQLYAPLSAQWPVVALVVLVVYQIARARWPNLNLPPILPGTSPTPADPTLPAPAPAAPSFPLLRALIDAWFKLQGRKAPADLSALPADQLAALWSEVDALVDAKAAKHEAELKELK